MSALGGNNGCQACRRDPFCPVKPENWAFSETWEDAQPKSNRRVIQKDGEGEMKAKTKTAATV